MKVKRIYKKLILIFLIISLLPFLRSCGDVSYGFPTVSIDSRNPFEFSRYIPSGFFINMLFMISAIFIVGNYYKPKLLKNIYFKCVIYSLLIYHLIYILAFTLYFIAPDIIEIISPILLIIYPALYLLTEFSFLEFKTLLFPDSMDFVVRLSYFLSILFYSLLGLLTGFVIKRKFRK